MAKKNIPEETESPFAAVHAGPSLEEIEQRDAQIRARNEGFPKVEFGHDEWDKKNIQSRRDAADELVDPWIAADPMGETVRAHEEPGFAYKFLSPRCNDVLGQRGYEIVRQENGDPVKMGTLLLGKIPEHIAQRRREFAVQKSAEDVASIRDNYGDKVRGLKQEAKDMGLRVLDPGEMDGVYNDPQTGRSMRIG